MGWDGRGRREEGEGGREGSVEGGRGREGSVEGGRDPGREGGMGG